MSEAKNIHEAIINVMSKVGTVKKDGKIKYGNKEYGYASEKEMLSSLRPCMLEANIICYPVETKMISHEIIDGVDRYGKEIKTFSFISEYSFCFLHAPSNTSIISKVINQGLDVGDKASSKSATNALKYALRQTFLIETGDESDKYASEEQAIYSEPKSTQSTTISPKPSEASITELRQKIYAGLMELTGDDEESARGMLKVFSEFTGKDGKVVPGEESTKKLSLGRLKVVYGKVKHELEEMRKKMKETQESTEADEADILFGNEE